MHPMKQVPRTACCLHQTTVSVSGSLPSSSISSVHLLPFSLSLPLYLSISLSFSSFPPPTPSPPFSPPPSPPLPPHPLPPSHSLLSLPLLSLSQSGYLNRKCLQDVGGKRSKDRSWQCVWCQLKGKTLEFYRVRGRKGEEGRRKERGGERVVGRREGGGERVVGRRGGRRREYVGEEGREDETQFGDQSELRVMPSDSSSVGCYVNCCYHNMYAK